MIGCGVWVLRVVMWFVVCRVGFAGGNVFNLVSCLPCCLGLYGWHVMPFASLVAVVWLRCFAGFVCCGQWFVGWV